MDINCSFSSYLISYGSCVTLAVLCVSSLYIWNFISPQKTENLSSNHPSVIKRRALSATFSSIISILVSFYFINQNYEKLGNFEFSKWEILGFRTEGLLAAIILPLVLTIILFSGPIVLKYYGDPSFFSLSEFCNEDLFSWLTFKNYIMAPVSEEIIFRSCMLSILVPCTSPTISVIFCPLLFGAAHLHHAHELVKSGGCSWRVALLSSLPVFLYTWIFGSYFAYLFLSTSHLITPILVHSFCNAMGVPNFEILQELELRDRVIIGAFFIGGLVLFFVMVGPMTESYLYSNKLDLFSLAH